jgi:drug/metabolite transporter (DMT)-like permease
MFGVRLSALTAIGIAVTCAGVALVAWPGRDARLQPAEAD